MTTNADHTGPAGTIADLITAYQAESGATDQQLAISLGYEQGNVVALIKRGVLKLPLNKVEALAEVTTVDPGRVLELALMERDPALLELIRSIKTRSTLTPAEMRLVEHCRTLAGDRDVSPFVIDGRSVVALVVR